ncbi:MAG: T9SS type A sorting domain-containing protein [Ignavibacteria bacterium]
MKRILTIILLLNLFYAGYSSADTVSTKFMPLKIGNVWTYVRTGGWPPYAPPVYFKSIVQRDTVIGGHTFYCLSNSEHFFPSVQNGNWFRVDSSDGKLINFALNACGSSNVYIMDSLASGINDLSRMCPNDTLHKRKLLSVVNNVRWGVQTVDLNFNWNSGPAGFLRTYSKYLGLTQSGYGEMNPLIYTLRGCIIDGVLYGDTNTFVGINQISSEIPRNFELSQNYPNPFNPSTHFGFRIADFGLVKLTIYDALGKEVAILVNIELQSGSYEADWDASAYTSGVYYYKLESGAFTETKKMVLIK